TSGATEANNLALKGAAHFARAHPQAGGKVRDHLIVLTTEHKCVLESAAALQREGFAISYLPVEPNGLVSLDRLAAAMSDRTLLVSVMAAHNEIGVIQPLAEIGALCRARGVLLHTDAAQAFGKIPLDVEAMRLDLMSISGHKIYGPKGIGALYIRRRPRVRLLPLIDACPSMAMSTGSACTSASVEPSYVLRALGFSDDRANASIRLGLGRFTTAAEVDFAVDAIAAAVSRVQKAGGIPTSG